MRSVNREVKPDNFAEVCDINALARPGPLHSGAAAEYIMVKHKKKKADRLHPIVSEITAHTNQQIVYQEQILQVVRRLGNFSWEEAANVRKLISKKQGEQAFNRLQGKFIEGAKENGVSEPMAHKIWKQLVTAGAYAFNAAHCVSYGMLAYWTMWLKVHHPVAFYNAALQKYKDKDKIHDIMKEAKKRGVKILPPDPALSQESWSIEGEALRAGFMQISGIAEKTSEKVLAYREEHGLESWDELINVEGIGPKTIAQIEEFVSDPDPFGLEVLSTTIRKVRRWIWENGEHHGLPYPQHKSEDVPYEAKPGEYIWLGVVRERNLKDLYELHRSRTGEELDPKSVKEPEHVNWMVLTCEDDSGPLVVTVHRYGGQYEREKEKLWDITLGKDLVLVRGYKRKEYRRAIYAKEIWVLEEE
jgi:DNA polymerase-3 subunit alpha